MTNYIIRKATEKDLDIILSMGRKIVDKYERTHLGDEMADGFINSGMCDQIYRDSLQNTSVLIDEKQIIGLIITVENTVQGFLINKKHWGTGAAQYLMSETLKTMAKKYKKVSLECFESSPIANSYYKKDGWKKTEVKQYKVNKKECIMIIIDKPYISEELKTYLDVSKVPVLKSEIAISENKGHFFNLIENTDFAKSYNEKSRLYTLSENSIDWVNKNIKNEELLNCINIMKDKFEFRKKISSLYKEFYFEKVFIDDLDKLEIDEDKFPLILKPTVGFFSAGVYALMDKRDLKIAVNDIKKSYGKWKNIFPSSVVGEDEFILEQYIVGEEYAIDAYFDENGKAVVLNILAHEFVSKTDVSDTLYYTSKEILQKYVPIFEDYLNNINTVLGVKNFPFHLEVRINENNEIAPIEFNPLRFAGWSTTDITYFAFGFFTYDYYFNNKRPDWEKLLKDKDNKKYTIIILNKPASYLVGDVFDFEMLKKDFIKIVCLRELDYKKEENPFGFLFTETPYSNLKELSKITNSDLSQYIIKS